jgi:hypothetical protein
VSPISRARAQSPVWSTIRLTRPDHVDADRHARIGTDLFGCSLPRLAADARQDRELPARKGRALKPFARVMIENPDMRDACPGPCCWLVVQFRIQFEGWFHLAIGHDRVRFVALVHLHAMGVELVLLEGDRLADGVALLFGRRGPHRSAHPCWPGSLRDRCRPSSRGTRRSGRTLRSTGWRASRSAWPPARVQRYSCPEASALPDP